MRDGHDLWAFSRADLVVHATDVNDAVTAALLSRRQHSRHPDESTTMRRPIPLSASASDLFVMRRGGREYYVLADRPQRPDAPVQIVPTRRGSSADRGAELVTPSVASQHHVRRRTANQCSYSAAVTNGQDKRGLRTDATVTILMWIRLSATYSVRRPDTDPCRPQHAPMTRTFLPPCGSSTYR